jgi:hypothetical protein
MQKIGGGSEHRDRREALHRIVADVLIDDGADDEGARIAEQQRMAVRLRLGGRPCPDGAAGARPILDHDALPQHDRETLPDEPCHDVGRPARRERHDDPDRLYRIGLRRRRSAKGAAGRSDGGQKKAFRNHNLLTSGAGRPPRRC